jgi:hypothetical protein
MSNNNSSVPPGLIQPTMASFTPGAGNPRDSALLAQQQMNAKQLSLNSSVGGRKRRYRGGADTVAVPQFQMPYTPTGGPGTNPNEQISGLSSTNMQSTSWAANDNLAAKKGGSRKRKGSKNNKTKNNKKKLIKRKTRHHRRNK